MTGPTKHGAIAVTAWLLVCAVLARPVSVLHAQPGGEHDPEELRCMALSMYWEARSEGREGMIAVGAVVLNRVGNDEFPDSVCGVVFDGGETPPCQFSWWCDGKSDTPGEHEQWEVAQRLAADMLSNPPQDPTDGALFFHHEGIEVPWRIARTRTVRIADHIYYR